MHFVWHGRVKRIGATQPDRRQRSAAVLVTQLVARNVIPCTRGSRRLELSITNCLPVWRDGRETNGATTYVAT